MLKTKCRMNNKGFSLVELIIVIAIMAVLIGVVGMQVVPYMNNSKRAKDLQILSAYVTAGMTAYTGHPDDIERDAPLVITITAGEDGDVYTCDEAPIVAAEMKKFIERNYVSEANEIFFSREFKKVESIVVTLDFDNNRIYAIAIDDSNNALNDADDVHGIL